MGAEARYGGVQLSAEFALPELGDCTTGGEPYLILNGTDGHRPSPSAWAHQWLNDSELVLSVARIDGKYLLEFDDGGSFTFDPSVRTVTCPQPIDAEVRHQLLDQVLPRVLEQLGHLMIHASAVLTPYGVVMFVADTGAGKSTLVASFQIAGMELLSDDCMRVILDPDGTVRCIPTYRSLRLWPDSADAIMGGEPHEPMSPDSDKRRVDLARVDPSAPIVVTAICALATADNDPSAITIAPVPASASGIDAARAVLPSRPDRRRLDEAHVRAVCRRRRARSRRGTHLPSRLRATTRGSRRSPGMCRHG